MGENSMAAAHVVLHFLVKDVTEVLIVWASYCLNLRLAELTKTKREGKPPQGDRSQIHLILSRVPRGISSFEAFDEDNSGGLLSIVRLPSIPILSCRKQVRSERSVRQTTAPAMSQRQKQQQKLKQVERPSNRSDIEKSAQLSMEDSVVEEEDNATPVISTQSVPPPLEDDEYFPRKNESPQDSRRLPSQDRPREDMEEQPRQGRRRASQDCRDEPQEERCQAAKPYHQDGIEHRRASQDRPRGDHEESRQDRRRAKEESPKKPTTSYTEPEPEEEEDAAEQQTPRPERRTSRRP